MLIASLPLGFSSITEMYGPLGSNAYVFATQTLPLPSTASEYGMFRSPPSDGDPGAGVPFVAIFAIDIP